MKRVKQWLVVNVVIKNTTQGTITDIDGRYSIMVIPLMIP